MSGSNFELQSTEGKEFFVLPVGTQRLAVYYKNGESALFNLPTDVSVNADKKKYFQEQTDRAETASTMYWHADIASYFAHDKKNLSKFASQMDGIPQTERLTFRQFNLKIPLLKPRGAEGEGSEDRVYQVAILKSMPMGQGPRPVRIGGPKIDGVETLDLKSRMTRGGSEVAGILENELLRQISYQTHFVAQYLIDDEADLATEYLSAIVENCKGISDNIDKYLHQEVKSRLARLQRGASAEAADGTDSAATDAVQ